MQDENFYQQSQPGFSSPPSDVRTGVQLLTHNGGEAQLLQLAYQLAAARPWTDELPAVHA